jgi:hypothetical protein
MSNKNSKSVVRDRNNKATSKASKQHQKCEEAHHESSVITLQQHCLLERLGYREAFRMEPPTKKPRTSPDSDISTTDALLQSEKVLGELAKAIGSMDPPGTSSKASLSTESLCNFLELKSIQRLVLDKLETSQAAIEDQFKLRDQEEMKLENLKYQKTLNAHSITVCNKLEKSQLAQLCCDEMDIPVPETDDELAEVFKAFLGADPKEPENRVKISAKLNLEVNTRTTLQAELKVNQQKAAAMKSVLAAKRKRLQELPSKLQEMEKASVPLQKFCQTYLHASKKLGSDRQTYLELARSLPKPLYTLYYQLQSCLDAMGSMRGSELGDHVPLLEITNNSSTVVLKIHIPTVSDTSTTAAFKNIEFAIIYFDFNKKWDMVTAYSSTDNGMGDLIGELFPGDTGEWTPSDDTHSSSGSKRPYNWCNYLGGLHLVPGDKKVSEMHVSTRVVVKVLVRRVRSLATLHAILPMLSRQPHPIPVHASMQNLFSSDDSSSVARLSGWTEEDTTETSRNFAATMTYESSTISIRVHINPKRYPAVPPEVRIAQGSSGTKSGSANEIGKDSELYNDRLAKLQRRVNEEVDQLVLTTDEASYDWILPHQLAEIAKALVT